MTLQLGFPDVYGKIMLGIAVSPGGAAGVLDLLAVIASANAGKQAGLYTDLDPDSGSWTVPGDVLSSECRVVSAEEPPRK